MEHVERALLLHADDKILQAARALDTARGALELLPAAARDALRARLDADDVQRVAREIADIRALMGALSSADGWTLSYGGATTKVWYRHEEGAAAHSLRVEGVIAAPLLNLATLLYESDLYSELLWFVQRAEVLAAPGRLRRAAHFRLYAPWPVSDRDVAVYGFGVDGLDEDGCVLVYSRSLRDDDAVPMPPEEGRVVRATVHRAGYQLQPVSPSETRVCFLFNADPRLTILPMNVINWVARTFCRWSLRAMESRARQLPPSYAKRQAERAVYRWFEGRLEEYWRARGRYDEYRQYSSSDPSAPVTRTAAESDDDDFDPNAQSIQPSTSIMASLIGMRTPGQSGDSATGRPSLGSRLFGGGKARQ